MPVAGTLGRLRQASLPWVSWSWSRRRRPPAPSVDERYRRCGSPPGSLTAIELIDPRTVAATLERLYHNPELLQKRSLAAYQHATSERYSWDTVAESFDEILTEVAQQQEAEPGSRFVQQQTTVLTGAGAA